MNTIRTNKGSYKGERLKVKRFQSADAMHKFLNTGDNTLHWRQTSGTDPVKPGTYAWAGGQWHNVKDLDPTVLAHI